MYAVTYMLPGVTTSDTMRDMEMFSDSANCWSRIFEKVSRSPALRITVV